MQIPELTETSRAVKMLREKSRRGGITLNDNPKTVWEAEPVFDVHKLDKFRAESNTIKAKLMEKDRKFSKLIYLF